MTIYEQVFHFLWQKKAPISREQLLETLELTTSDLSNALQDLADLGVIITESKQDLEWLSGDLLLTSELPHNTTLLLHSDSTQLDAKNSPEAGRLFVANQQAAATGRFGRAYFAEKGHGIYMSKVIAPHGAISQATDYTLLAAVSVLSAIQELTDFNPKIKWVNDIYLNQKKIAGILTEAILDPSTGTLSSIIIGIGLNFHLTHIPLDLTDKAASLFESRPNITRNQLITEIWRQFDLWRTKDFFSYYKANSLVLGKSISFKQNNTIIKGVAKDLTPSGHLLVDTQDGRATLSSGEVSLLSWD